MTKSAFESSLAALRDNVVMAIERREVGVVQDGLDVYMHLIETIIDEQLRLQTLSANSATPEDGFGREWDLVIRDLHGVIDSVSASDSRLLWIDAMSWVRKISVLCADRGMANALRSILTLFASAWRQELVAPGADVAARQDALLLRLAEIGNFDLHLDRAEEAVPLGIAAIYTRTFLDVIKSAIDSDDPEAARVAIRYFLYGTTSPRLQMNSIVGAGLLALYGWILYGFDHGNRTEAYKETCRQIATSFEDVRALIPMLRASHRHEDELGVHWWEMRDRGPISSGIIEIGTYISLAFILVGGRRLLQEPFDPTSSDDVASARELVDVIDSIETGSFASAREMISVSDDFLRHLKTHLTRVISQGDAILEEEDSRRQIDPSRVETFVDSVRQKLVEQRSRSLVYSLRSEPASKVVPARSNFGIDRLVPRWYFAETRVFASAADLADQLVGALFRGIEDRILEVVVDDDTITADTTLESLEANLEQAINKQKLPRPVVVTNSFQAHALLKGRRLDNIDASAEEFTKGSVFRVFDDRNPYVALLSAAGSPTVQLSPLAPEIEGDRAYNDLGVIVGVSEVPAEEMSEIIGRKERPRREEAQLRGSLRTRLLVHLSVTVQDGRRPVIWKLPESTW
ncbi:hypothetical protein ACIA03_11560 [Nocardioides sp. NPDC051685]|uniref:hypothetical protein n=1 Tax=Nocardioides sp. NPDC051685 TaxID=3364334 RepID=UPI0037BA1413